MTQISVEKESWNELDRLVSVLTDLAHAHLNEASPDQSVVASAIDELRSCWEMTDHWETNRAGSVLGVRDPVENFYNDLYASYCAEVTGIEFRGQDFQPALLCMMRVVATSLGRMDSGTDLMKGKAELIEAVHSMADVNKRHVQLVFRNLAIKRKKETMDNSDL